MDSLTVLFTAQDTVEVFSEPVREPGEREVLLQTECTLISTGTECTFLQRKFEPGSHWDKYGQLPVRPGYSQTGRVLRIGSGVSKHKVGDRVASSGPHSQFVTIDENSAWPIPEAVTSEAATWGILAYVVQRGIRKAQIELGETVVVIGLGMLGQLAVQYAKASGAGEVIAIDTAPRRLAMAAAHGATHALEMDAAGAEATIAELTGGRMADIVFDVTGHPAVFSGATKLLRRFGRLVLIGDAGAPSAQALTSDVMMKDLQILAAHGGNAPAEASDFARWSHTEMVRVFYKFLERGQMRVDDLITHRFAVGDAAAAYRLLTADRAAAMGVVLEFDSAS